MIKMMLLLILTLFAFNVASAEENFCSEYAKSFDFDKLKQELTRISPVEFLDITSQVNLIISDQDMHALIPKASSKNDIKNIYASKNSIELICNLTYPTTIAIRLMDGQASDNLKKLFESITIPSLIENSTCKDDKKKIYSECLLNFSRVIQKNSENLLSILKKNKKDFNLEKIIAYDTNNAVRSIFFHEMSHHLLDHFNRIKNKEIQRSQAEYEADTFSMLTLLQIGKDNSSYLEFFHTLGFFESDYTTKKSDSYNSTSIFDSSECRFMNAALIESYTGRGGATIILNMLEKGYNNNHDIKILSELKSTLIEISELSKVDVCNDGIYKQAKDLNKELIEILDFFIKNKNVFFSDEDLIEKEVAPLFGKKENILNAITEFTKSLNPELKLKNFRAKLLLTMILRLTSTKEIISTEYSEKVELINIIKNALEKVIVNASLSDSEKALNFLEITKKGEENLTSNND